MTTNNKNKFFWSRIQKNLPYILNISIIAFSIGILFLIFCQKEKNLNVHSIKVNDGWGYAITNNNQLIIKQTIIPVISERKSFQTEQEAMAVGHLVVQKLDSNLSPTITEKDLILLKIKR